MSVTKNGLFREMQNIKTQLNRGNGLRDNLTAVAPGLMDVLQLDDLYYVEANGRMRSVMDPSFDGDADDISNLMKEEIFNDRTLERVEKDSPIFFGTLKERGLASALIMRFEIGGTDHGYLICAVERKYRIWQDNECAVLYYLAGLLEKKEWRE